MLPKGGLCVHWIKLRTMLSVILQQSQKSDRAFYGHVVYVICGQCHNNSNFAFMPWKAECVIPLSSTNFNWKRPVHCLLSHRAVLLLVYSHQFRVGSMWTAKAYELHKLAMLAGRKTWKTWPKTWKWPGPPLTCETTKTIKILKPKMNKL